MKLSVDIASLIQHNSGQASTYIFDEQLGPKNSNHTLSLLTKHIAALDLSWITKVVIFMDSAPSTNKNSWLICWMNEMLIMHQTLQYIRVCFMVVGHTKSMPDWVFASIASSMKKTDVFTMDELADVASIYSQSQVTVQNDFMDWRKSLESKYGRYVLHGITKYHDFRAERRQNSVAILVRENLDSGDWKEVTLNVKDSVQGLPAETICNRQLTSEKLRHLTEMYDRYIPRERRLSLLPLPYVISKRTVTELCCNTEPGTSQLGTRFIREVNKQRTTRLTSSQ
ncbi:uncharacterized protein [Ptychodera flava]|uniref:uncharacterized protein n=1 Tax=Ptychodera flava TaxID=63121 RepID=UPI00396A0629